MVSLEKRLIIPRTEVVTVGEVRIAILLRLCSWVFQSIDDGERSRANNCICSIVLATVDGKTPSGWSDCGKYRPHVSPDATTLWTMVRIFGKK